MGLQERIGWYRQIEELRGRPLIVYVTSSRQGAPGFMAGDMVPEILDQINRLPDNAQAVDLLVVSQGGDPTVAWRTMCLLRERYDQVGVLVPQSAFSAATLLCLGADEILMHRNGNLGPVDPQITTVRKGGNGEPSQVKFGFEEVVAFVDFIKERAHITDQRELSAMVTKLLDDIGTVTVGTAVRGSLLSTSLGANLLRMHMTDEGEASKAKEIAETLNKKFLHHGYAVGRREAQGIDLKVVEPGQQLESLMWRVWEDLEAELQMRRRYHPISELANFAPAAPLFGPIMAINIPQGLPAPLAQQVFAQLAQQLQVQINNIPPMESDICCAVMESRRISSRFVIHKKVYGFRQGDGQIAAHIVDTGAAWEQVPLPPEPVQEPAVSLAADIGTIQQEPEPQGIVIAGASSAEAGSSVATATATERAVARTGTTTPRKKKVPR